MKKILSILVIFTVSILSSSAQYVDDLYATPQTKAERQAASLEAQEAKEANAKEKQAKKEARALAEQAEYEKMQQESDYFAYQIVQKIQGTDNYGDNELVSSIDQALLRRQEAFRTLNLQHDQSYWTTMENYYNLLAAKYNEDLYNIIAIGDRVWVEPQYITAIFDDSDPAEGINTYANKNAKKYIKQNIKNETPVQEININIYNNFSSPYYSYFSPYRFSFGLGWGGGYYPYNPYYTGFYPYNPYWFGYNPYYPGWGGGGYYPGYYPGWGGGYYPGHYPGHYPGWGGGGYYPGGGGGSVIVVKPSRPVYQGHSRHNNGYNGGHANYNTTRDKYRPNVTPTNNNNSVYRPSTGVSNRPNNNNNNQQNYNRPQPRPKTNPTPAVSRPSTNHTPAFRPTQGGTKRR